MKKKNRKYLWLLLLFGLFMLKTNYFRPMSNFGRNQTVTLDMDLDNAVIEGVTLPSVAQTKDGSGMFELAF